MINTNTNTTTNEKNTTTNDITTSIIPGINTNHHQSNKIKSKTVLNLRALSKDNNNSSSSSSSNRNYAFYQKEKSLCSSINDFVDSIKEGGYLVLDQIPLVVDDIREEILKEVDVLLSLIVLLNKEIDSHTEVILTSRSSNNDNDNTDSITNTCVLCKTRNGHNIIPSIYPTNSNNTSSTNSCILCRDKSITKTVNNNIDDSNTNTNSRGSSRVRSKFQSVLDEKYFLDDDSLY